MQKITPHLWFDKEAIEAAKFYTAIFKDSKIKNTATFHDTPSGLVDSITFELCGQEFMAISAGPYFKFTPAVSFLVACASPQEVDALWEKLSVGGSVLMELGQYPFSERYGWLNDKYGLSWQIMFVDRHEIKQAITPTFMFVGQISGKAEEAINFYASVFQNAKIGSLLRYGEGEMPDKPGTLKYSEFELEGQGFVAMDSAHKHDFSFSEAVSFIVNCETQEEVDYYWEKLSADPKAEQCGWIKDKYGLSWQIIPTALSELLSKDKSGKVMQAMLKMKKIDQAVLEEAAAENK